MVCKYGSGHVILLLLSLVTGLALVDALSRLKNDSACYGTFNHYINLACDVGEHIRVIRHIYGAKPNVMLCEPFSTPDRPQPQCCEPGPGDCTASLNPSTTKCPDGAQTCNLVTDWVDTYTFCDQNLYPITSNYMSIEYTCEKNDDGFTSAAGSGDTLPITVRIKEPDGRGQNSGQDGLVGTVDTTVSDGHTDFQSDGRDDGRQSNTTFPVLINGVGPKSVVDGGGGVVGDQSSEDELNDSMIAAVLGGSLGMCLTLVLFICYWRRKKRLRIVSNKQPTVWDYLLTNTFTVRGLNGYDHFSSTRSSASSDGENGSPVIRKNMWLPNIVQDTEELQDDVISNYDNTRYKVPKVEVHPGATPSPYAILNLETVNNISSSNNNRHRDNHDV